MLECPLPVTSFPSMPAVGRRSQAWRRAARVALVGLCVVGIAGLGLWGGLALWYRLPLGEGGRAFVVGLWAGAACLALLAQFTRRRLAGTLGFALLAAGLVAWWSTIAPSNDRVWTPDVARTVTASVSGDAVSVRDIRNFEWRSDTDFTQTWENREYRLSQLTGIDLFVSYWAGEAIAHTILSFTFEDRPPLAFSVEIRKERGEAYSEIAGFFKQYEVVLIAADERDIVRVRSNVRGEDVRIYRLAVPVATARALFLAYLDEANRLAAAPRFYNTVTTNCTTLVFGMAQAVSGNRLPLDWRVLVSGYLPDYLHDAGALGPRPFADLRAVAPIAARAANGDPDFSSSIRQEP